MERLKNYIGIYFNLPGKERLKFHSHILSPVLHFLYPHICIGCGSDIIEDNNFLCLDCIENLPHTGFAMHANNPVEKIFRGRLPLASGTSEFYFSKDSLIQNVIHEFKYKGNLKLGKYLGRIMGSSLAASDRFSQIDLVIPLPLFSKKELKRGYNQAKILCEGIAEVLKVPLEVQSVIRIYNTETQTKKGRIERWENVEKSFSVLAPEMLEGKNILLVDDVVTTGATLEACAAQILKTKNVTLSIATLAFATH
ncbi:MAG: phosphoribosyltransferase family protein [Ginsengibacter sp.]